MQWDDSAATNYNQQWAITKNSYGWYPIKNRMSQKYLDTNDAATDGVQVVQRGARTSWSQEWNFMIKL